MEADGMIFALEGTPRRLTVPTTGKGGSAEHPTAINVSSQCADGSKEIASGDTITMNVEHDSRSPLPQSSPQPPDPVHLPPSSASATSIDIPLSTVPTLINSASCGNSPYLPSTEPDASEHDLPPVDRGVNAWTFCAAAFAIEFLFWGPQSAFGTFQSYYDMHEPFDRASSTAIAAIGTTGLAFEYSAGIILMVIFQNRPQYLRLLMHFGLLMWLAGMLGASFATKAWQLIICQGVLPGLAAAIISFPTYIWVTHWFVKRRGLASGLIITGASLGGVCLPLFTDALLKRFGVPWTMRIWTLATGVLGTVALHFSRPRLPPGSKTPGARPVFKFRSMMKGPFLAVALASFLQAAGYFPVSVFLPTQASNLGISNPNIILSALNLACIPGRLFWGRASDKFSYIGLMAGSSAISGVLAYLLYGFASGLAGLLTFSLLFGLLAGGYSSMWAQAARTISSSKPEHVPVLYSALFLARGGGCIVGPIVGSILYHPSTTIRGGINGSAYGLYNSGPLSIFVGSALVTSALVGLWAWPAQMRNSTVTSGRLSGKMGRVLRSFNALRA
ncbi:hypothetical protein EW146_g2774 [Bondarzewia mesenterica]|uniref:Major facilitator superfamily (MFS) profile domain-containing protein n=1 Tax=Bondarzewia mesenterica TaxID=1095465 RepID=A0A4S4LZQ7_9AGAM|nr:hypothetical protein EW146_g2774 [Bondarzewia mesenterica]